MFESAQSYFATWTDGWVGESHLIAGVSALISGALILLIRKGTPPHVLLGYGYLASMIALNATALIKYDLTGSPNLFHAAAIVSGLTLMAAYASAIVFRLTARPGAAAMHGIFMIWSYFGLVAAFVAEIVTRQFPFMLHGDGGWWRFTSALALFMAATALVTHRYAKAEVARTLSH
ncbi:MAG: hypothetical protein GC152_14675 [Alphaproteobacteria bacterium]|nr:hypothetical protein [Alphaproteobacteria bacterium]